MKSTFTSVFIGGNPLMFNCDNQKKEKGRKMAALFSRKINSKNVFPDFTNKFNFGNLL